MSTLGVSLNVGKDKARLVTVKKAIVGFWLIFLINSISFGQTTTCTISGSGTINWTNPGPNCTEGGNAGSKTFLKIPVGVTLVFNDNTDTWSGTMIEVYGTLNITASPTIYSSIVVMSGGKVNITGKLGLGDGNAACNYSLAVRSGGVVDVGGTGSDRLAICNVEVMKGSGGCNSCGGTNSGQCPYNNQPYCEPTNGFTGPTGYYKGGYDSTLPVSLLYFRAEDEGQAVGVEWATTTEKGLQKFVVQRSQNGIDFRDIGEVQSAGVDTDNLKTVYSFTDKAPLLGFNYYRLKAIDLDESSEFFGMEMVKFSGSKHMTVYPNPSSGNTFQIQTNFSPSEHDYIRVSNALGVDIMKLAMSKFEGQITFDQKLQPGVYLVSYFSTDFKEVSRVIVRN